MIESSSYMSLGMSKKIHQSLFSERFFCTTEILVNFAIGQILQCFFQVFAFIFIHGDNLLYFIIFSILLYFSDIVNSSI